MKNNSIIIGLSLVVVVLGVYVVFGAPRADVEVAHAIGVKIYKSPTCGCCGVYASYMKKEGYEVITENIQDMSEIKQKLGVPYELESCHTMLVEGYVVEGHVPEIAIEKLLTERPDIKGIGMSGMPSGSPGMPGPKNDDFVIYEIQHDGTKGNVFMTI